MESSSNLNVYAVVNSTEYPFGTLTWSIYGDHCSEEEHILTPLNINTCEFSQFNCGDGACVDIDLRCNGNLDCPDASGMEICWLLTKNNYIIP